MLITELKKEDEILPLLTGKTFILGCEGCKEVYFPYNEAAEIQNKLMNDNTATAAVVTDYICNPDNLRLQLQKSTEFVNSADNMLVFSCGIGVQTVAGEFPEKTVYAACDTYPLPGHQGVTPLEHECAQCGECYLNETGGICPITSCSKSLVNGQCGGSKNGKCEVDKDMECGWERIYRRLEKLSSLDIMRNPVLVRNFGSVK